MTAIRSVEIDPGTIGSGRISPATISPRSSPGSSPGITPGISTARTGTDEGDADTGLSRLLPAHSSPLAWIRHGDGVIGWGETARLEVRGPDRFAKAQSWWQEWCSGLDVDDAVGAFGSGPLAFGSFAFDDESDEPSVLIVPRVVVGQGGGRAWITAADPLPQLAPAPSPPPAGTVRYSAGALSPGEWQSAVRTAVEQIQAGELAKVVLARDIWAEADHPLDPRLLVQQLSAAYAGCWTYAVNGLVGATPELLVRSKGGLVTSRVLAGTIRRSGDDRHDLQLAASLARSSKDLEEHNYAVRSVAENLAPHCAGMHVPDSPYVLHLPNVMHLATDVSAARQPGENALSLAAALHPTAAVCGTPRETALAVLRNLEQLDRGRYAGPVGWIDAAGDGEWGIALRCGRLDAEDPRRIRLYAGCGIVGGSDPVAELAEAEAKLRPMREALGD